MICKNWQFTLKIKLSCNIINKYFNFNSECQNFLGSILLETQANAQNI